VQPLGRQIANKFCENLRKAASQSSHWLAYNGTSQIHPQNCPFPSTITTPFNTAIPRPTPLTIPNGIRIHSAVLPQYTFRTDTPTDRWARRQVSKISRLRLTLSDAASNNSNNGPLSGTTRVSRYQKGKPIWIYWSKREWQWHQLGHMQICTSSQTNNHVHKRRS